MLEEGLFRKDLKMGNLPKANKDLGQHFLVDQRVISTICNDHKEIEAIIEVGPGPAVLSKTLSEKEYPYYIIEKDTRFEPLLAPLTDPDKLYITDALKFDWPSFFKQHDLENKHCWLVSNLPYNISVPLLMAFMKQAPIKSMSLMFQKEVGIKVIDIPGAKNDMSSLKALAQTYFDCSTLLKVAPGAFSPPPKVDSIVVSFARKEKPVVSLEEFQYFEDLLRKLFQFKRKQLRSVCKSWLSSDVLEEIFETTGIDPKRRAETLTLEEIYKFYRHLRS